ncbi:beta-1,3-galactosyltransferase 1-like [Ciona intestinalis]
MNSSKLITFGCVALLSLVLIKLYFVQTWFKSNGKFVSRISSRGNRTVVLTPRSNISTAVVTTPFTVRPTIYPQMPLVTQPTLSPNCSATTRTATVCIVCFIISPPNNFVLRQTIRDTEGSISYLNGFNIKYVFVLAKSTDENINKRILEESEKQKDILFIDYVDTYRKIVMKSLTILQWSSENLPSHYFVSKSDDDVRISKTTLTNHLTKLLNTSNVASPERPTLGKGVENFPILCGHTLVKNGYPTRDQNSRYYLSTDEYKPNTLPSYCNGAMYVTSVATSKLLYASVKQEEIMPMEDVWASGILRMKLGKEDTNIVKLEPGFAFHFPDLSTPQAQAKIIEHLKKEITILKNFNVSYCC